LKFNMSIKGRDGILEEQELGDSVAALDETLKSIEAHLTSFFAVPLEEQIQNLDSHEIAKLNIVMAYSINTLFYIYLKTQGVSPVNHPVKKELERIKSYIKKMKELSEKKKQESTLRLNVDAAQRFIKHSLESTKNTE